MTRVKKIVIAASIAVALLLVGGFAWLWLLYGNPAPDSPAMEAYGLPDYGIVIEGPDVEATKDLLHFWLATSCRGEQLAQSPRIRYLLNRPGNKVMLTPNDQVMIYIYSLGEEAVADVIERHAGENLGVRLYPTEGGGYAFEGPKCTCAPDDGQSGKKPYDCGCGGSC